MDNLIYWVWLSLNTSPNNKMIRKLLLETGDPRTIYFMDEDKLNKIPYLNEYSILKLLNKDIDEAKKIIEKCETNNYNIICYADEYYPDRLRNIEDFPIVLYHRGHKFKFDDLLCISVVGTRKASGYGIQAAKMISRELAHNKVLVISGMALGIDAAAHSGAMSIDKPTVAVLGSGIDVIAPKTNSYLYEYMLSNGAIYSEYPPGTQGWPNNYPERNRIISALSLGVLVVEAEEISGALITAECALRQGKDVFAVPNSIENIKAKGTHKLIKDGAILTTCAADILNEYKGMYIDEEDISTFDEQEYNEEFLADDFIEKFEDLTPMEKEIARTMGKKEITPDEIAEKSDIPIHYVLSSLTILEIKGVIKSSSGQGYKLNID
jgi:DNA processing protein